MAAPPECPKCGGPMDEGTLESAAWYVSDHAQRPAFWSLDPKVIIKRARVCVACGYIEMFLDPQQLQKYISAP